MPASKSFLPYKNCALYVILGCGSKFYIAFIFHLIPLEFMGSSRLLRLCHPSAKLAPWYSPHQFSSLTLEFKNHLHLLCAVMPLHCEFSSSSSLSLMAVGRENTWYDVIPLDMWSYMPQRRGWLKDVISSIFLLHMFYIMYSSSSGMHWLFERSDCPLIVLPLFSVFLHVI